MEHRVAVCDWREIPRGSKSAARANRRRSAKAEVQKVKQVRGLNGRGRSSMDVKDG